MLISPILNKLIARQDLATAEATGLMGAIMDGDITPGQFGAIVMALRMKGETSDEVCGFASAMRERSIKVRTSRQLLVDTCGTGGDTQNTFNISTTSAFVVAGAGVAVAKHGNRAASSKCGSADLLEALGVNIALTPERVGQLIDQTGIGFLFAAALHPAMKHAAAPRREIGVRTVFNILGPLTNPAGAKRQVVGVFEPSTCELLAHALAKLGSERALVVHGVEGIDEISNFCETIVSELAEGQVRTYSISPSDVGLARRSVSEIQGGEPADNARIFMQVLSGSGGAAREIVCLNAGAALYAADVTGSLQKGLELADATISSGAALEVFERYKALSNSGAPE